MNARMRRIASDSEQVKKNFANHKHIVIEPIGPEPAEKYRVTYYVNGIFLREDGTIETLGKHIVIITLHAEYPRYKPICTIATPIWHPNFRDGQICIGDIWGAGESLSDIIVNIGDMIQYKSWNSFSPLSAEAAEWAIEHKHLFPVGNINLWTGEEEDGSVKTAFDIDILDEADQEDGVSDEGNAPEDGALEAAAEEVQSAESGAAVSGGGADIGAAGAAEELNQADAAAESNTANQAIAVIEDENDFEITAEELVGIEFVPTAERMQGRRYGAPAKGGKFNFKTVLMKGLIWALIGAFIGFGFGELTDGLTGNASVARMLGHPELAQYYEYTEQATEALSPVLAVFEKECKAKGIDPKREGALTEWAEQHASECSEVLEEYLEKSEKANEALAKAFEYDFHSTMYEMKDAMAGISRIGTALWSAIIALFIGLFLGLGEGVYYGSKSNAVKYALIGAAISIVVGAFSGYVAQWMYGSLLTDYSSDVVKALVRGAGWAVMGLGIGLSAGLIKPGAKRIAFCSLGGVLGAFVGGFLFNYICAIITNDVVARGIAVVIMGLLIGTGVGALEQFAKAAWLKVIRGEFEGKEYLVFEGTTSIGNSGNNTIVLFKDKLVAPNHCDIVQEGGKYVLVDKNSPTGTIVNGMRITRHVLKNGDAIAVGNSVLVFNTK